MKGTVERDRVRVYLEATSVANRMRTWSDLNFAREAKRCRCFISEWISTDGMWNFRHIIERI